MNKLISSVSAFAFAAAAFHSANANGMENNDAPAVEEEQESKLPFKVEVSGQAVATTYFYKNAKNIFGNAPNEKGSGVHFAAEDSAIKLKALGSVDALGGIDYDWQMGISADTSATKSVYENRIRIQSATFGTFMFGGHKGVEDFMARGAFSIPVATGGYDGNFTTVAVIPTGMFIGTDMVGASGRATKFSYSTARFYGFQAGLSYTPNSEHNGEAAPQNITSLKKKPFDRHHIAAGLNFEHDFHSGLKVALSGTGVFGNTKPAIGTGFNAANAFTATQTVKRNNTKSYAVGITAEYQGFEVGFEYIDNRKSRSVKRGTAYDNVINTALSALPAGRNTIGTFNAGRAYNAAAAYSFGDAKVSYGFFHSNAKINGGKAIANIHSLGAEYQVFDGITLFAEGILGSLKNDQRVLDFQTALNTADASADKAIGSNTRARSLLTGIKFKF